MERNQSVFSRKDLIKLEYNKIMEQRLPNILSLMNNDKQQTMIDGVSISHHESVNAEYDETEFISKLFSKDHQNRPGYL